jgi:hypothetical protein
MEGLGKILLIVGGVIMLLGLLLVFHQHIPFLGKLPGDIIIKKEGFSIYFPIVTFIIISILLTVLVNIIIFFVNK